MRTPSQLAEILSYVFNNGYRGISRTDPTGEIRAEITQQVRDMRKENLAEFLGMFERSEDAEGNLKTALCWLLGEVLLADKRSSNK